MIKPAGPQERQVKLLHSTAVPYQLNYLAGQVSYLKAKGFDVCALSSPGKLLTEFGEREGIPVHGVEISRRIAPLSDLRSILQFILKLRSIRPAIVHSHTPKGALIGMIAAALTGVPLRIYNIHGLPTTTATGLKRLLLRCSEKTACALAHRVLCVSESVRKMAVAEGLCAPEKIKVLRSGSINGIDGDNRFNPDKLDDGARLRVRQKYGIPADAVVAGFIGRIVREKGLVELAEALLALRDRHPELHLMMVGPFEPQDPLPMETERALREDPRVHLVGLEWDTPPLYAAMDMFALPSYREGFPVVLLEAASMSLPIVATHAVGCVDAVEDGVTGTLVPVGDSNALADAMSRYVSDPDLRLTHGRAGRLRVLRDFRREDVWEAVYEEYVGLLRMKGLPVPEPAGERG